MKKIILFLIVLSFVLVAKIAFASPLSDCQRGIYFFNKLKQTPFPHQNQYMPVRYELFKKAIYYFKKAAHAGYIPADYYLSKIYYLGDTNEIVYWRDSNGDSCAADQGESGRKTEYYIKKAAYAGYIPAELKLAFYYSNGILNTQLIHNSSCLHAPWTSVLRVSQKKFLYWVKKVLENGKKYCPQVPFPSNYLKMTTAYKDILIKYCGLSFCKKNYICGH